MVVPQSSSRGSLKTIDATAPVFDLLYVDIQRVLHRVAHIFIKLNL